MKLSDGSAMRVTIARYYTPSGRCIQKPYNEGVDAYYSDLSNRFKQWRGIFKRFNHLQGYRSVQNG